MKGKISCNTGKRLKKNQINNELIDLRSESSNEGLQFLNEILNKPMKNFRQRGDEDEFANIYELNNSEEIKFEENKSINKRN